MKKSVLIGSFLILLLLPVSVFAIDYSVGGSIDLGLSVVRGGYRNNLGDIQEVFVDAGRGSDAEVNYFAYAPKVDVLLEFNDNFALETGVGYRNAKSEFDFTYSNAKQKTTFSRDELVLPAMLRAQFTYSRNNKVMFLSVGPKLGIPLSDDYFRESLSGALYGTVIIESAPVFLDLGISVGQDHRLGRSTYFVFRANYDINLLEPFKVDSATSNVLGELRHDVISITLGFRQKF